MRAGSGNLPWGSQQFKWRQHNVNVSDVWVISADKINQVWLTYTRNFGGRLNLPATSLGDLGSAFTIQGEPSLPQITVNGFFPTDKRHRRPESRDKLLLHPRRVQLDQGQPLPEVGRRVLAQQRHPADAAQQLRSLHLQ